MLSVITRRAGPAFRGSSRCFSVSSSRPTKTPQTLEENKSIYIHHLPQSTPPTYALSFLPTPPPKLNLHLALGTTTTLPPTPHTFTENPNFRKILMSTLKEHSHNDPEVINEAYSLWGASMGVAAISQRTRSRQRRDGGSGGTEAVGGFHHIVDRRTPYLGGMRIPESQDILGSVQVDGGGRVLGGFEECESYRLVTGDGVMRLSEYLEGKLVERLREEEVMGGE
ncbi:hypothetical protein ABW19_dt0202228 [Dactylella cylindrospora]|nr:hypothetical protein ABW19_dt0202228 [Dactylella cylindrospora]